MNKIATLCSSLCMLLGVGCRCQNASSGGEEASPLDEAGMFEEYPVRYELHVEGNAATVTVNGSAHLIICDTFSENCSLADLPSPLPRLRHHESSAELTPYLRNGPNEVRIEVRPDGDDDAPVSYDLIREQEGRPREILAQGKVALETTGGAALAVETPSDCSTPETPDIMWVTRFLEPHSEATLHRTADAYAELLPPPRSADEAARRGERFDTLRRLSLNDYPFPQDAVQQTHLSAPLALNYSCENERLFVHPVDGGYLFAAVEIERHDDGPLLGSVTKSILGSAAALALWQGRWYFAEPL